MGSVKVFCIAIFISLGLCSCALLGINGLFEKGYIDVNEQYIPKRPRFKLKDKPNNVIPNSLDTINIYRLYQRYYSGKIHPSPDDKYSELNKVKVYKKFYSKGRCLSFAIPSVDDFGNENYLKEGDLSPNNSGYSKEYYYSKDGEVIRIESFVYGEGYGIYVNFDYTISSFGDTLTKTYKNSKEVYVKEKLPMNWIKYNFDW